MKPDGLAIGSIYVSDTGTKTLYRFSLAAPTPPRTPVVVTPRFTG
jgi:hypothetical protein